MIFVGHEVAHALYTEEKWLEAVKSEGDGFHGFLNVVEDARIEKLIARRCWSCVNSLSSRTRSFLLMASLEKAKMR